MKKLKIINRSGMEFRLSKLVLDVQIGETITMTPGHEYEYACDSELVDKAIRLDVRYSEDFRVYIHLNSDFIDAYKIAYVRKGDDDHWFVDPVHRAAKLVRKHVYNSTISPIALVECVLKQTGETESMRERINCASRTTWSEITVPSRTKYLLIVDPVAMKRGDRRYFVRAGGGPPLFGSINGVMSRQQNNNVNGGLCEIIMTQCNEYVEIKEHPHGMLELTSSWRPPCLF